MYPVLSKNSWIQLHFSVTTPGLTYQCVNMLIRGQKKVFKKVSADCVNRTRNAQYNIINSKRNVYRSTHPINEKMFPACICVVNLLRELFLTQPLESHWVPAAGNYQVKSARPWIIQCGCCTIKSGSNQSMLPNNYLLVHTWISAMNNSNNHIAPIRGFTPPDPNLNRLH